MQFITADQMNAKDFVTAIKGGDTTALSEMLVLYPWLAKCLIVEADGTGRRPLHLLADTPGHRPRQRDILRILVDAGADVNDTPVRMPHSESPLHWAAKNDDVELIDALLDAGADIERPGSSFGGGSPIHTALAHGKYNAMRRLLERGAKVMLSHLVVLGLADRVRNILTTTTPPQWDRDSALWNACYRGDIVLARLLVDHGANPYWADPRTNISSFDVALAASQLHLVPWLQSLRQALPA